MLLLLLSLYCIDLFSYKAASVFIINLLTYTLTSRYFVVGYSNLLSEGIYLFRFQLLFVSAASVIMGNEDYQN